MQCSVVFVLTMFWFSHPGAALLCEDSCLTNELLVAESVCCRSALRALQDALCGAPPF